MSSSRAVLVTQPHVKHVNMFWYWFDPALEPLSGSQPSAHGVGCFGSATFFFCGTLGLVGSLGLTQL